MVARADAVHETDTPAGSGYCDRATLELAAAAAVYEDLLKTKLAMSQRGMEILAFSDGGVEFFGSDLESLVNRSAAQVSRKLRKHPIWPWLKNYPGLGGVHTARVMARIRDPRRFPGQPCSEGHLQPAIFELGAACPWGGCGGVMLTPRPHSGVRSVWHYFGLHVVDGKSPRKSKGTPCDWDPIGRAAVLQPMGIADHIVQMRVPYYRDHWYDRAKERIQRERGADLDPAADNVTGLAPTSPSGVETEGERGELVGPGHPVGQAEIDLEPDRRHGLSDSVGTGVGMRAETARRLGLRPFEVDARARKIAAKQFLGDLLTEWKRVLEPQPARAEPEPETDAANGPRSHLGQGAT